MHAKRKALAEQIATWADSVCGPYGEAYKQNLIIELVRSRANLRKLLKSDKRAKMHDINFIISHTKGELLCGYVS